MTVAVVVEIVIVIHCVRSAVITVAIRTPISALNAVVTVAKIVGTMMHVASVVAAAKVVCAPSQNSRA